MPPCVIVIIAHKSDVVCQVCHWSLGVGGGGLGGFDCHCLLEHLEVCGGGWFFRGRAFSLSSQMCTSPHTRDDREGDVTWKHQWQAKGEE